MMDATLRHVIRMIKVGDTSSIIQFQRGSIHQSCCNSLSVINDVYIYIYIYIYICIYIYIYVCIYIYIYIYIYI